MGSTVLRRPHFFSGLWHHPRKLTGARTHYIYAQARKDAHPQTSRIACRMQGLSACSTASVKFPGSHHTGISRQLRRCGSRGTPVAKAAVDSRPAPTPSDVLELRTSEAALQTAFGSIEFEQVKEIQMETKGKIPKWVKGELVSNGCGSYRYMKHMFDGLALFHKMRVIDGEIFSSHKFANTKAYEYFKKEGKLKYHEFMASPPYEGLRKLLYYLSYSSKALLGLEGGTSDNANVSILTLGDTVIAASEPRTASYELDVATLSVGSPVPYENIEDMQLTTAHPYTTENGDIINVAVDVVKGFTVYRTDASTKESEAIAFLPLKKPFAASWIHDFPCTEKYAAIVQTPCRYNIGSLILGNDADYTIMSWNPEDETVISLVPLNGEGKIRTFRCPSFFAFHYGNAFESEDGQYFCFDVAMYKDPEVLNDLYLDTLLKGDHNVSDSGMYRITLPLDNDQEEPVDARITQLADPADHGHYVEFPSINERYRGKTHRYLYTTACCRPTPTQNALAKVDSKTNTCKLWKLPGGYTGEPHFIEAPNPSSEDDGVLIAEIIKADGTSGLVVLDAKSFEELAISSLPYGIPARFHGRFFKK